MRETSSRLLALLALMQSRPAWPGSELAERLGVSTRTIRNDIERLRELGYPVDAVRGPAGHYQLGVGAKLPPLLLDDDEAVAVAIALRTGGGVSGIGESGSRALAKLEHVLPHRLRRQVRAIQSATTKGPDNTSSNVKEPQADPVVLAALAAAIRDQHGVRMRYGDPQAALELPTTLVEPYRLVSWARYWYLVARSPETGDWRTYRVDWIDLRTPAGRRFTPITFPGEDYTDFVLRDVAFTGWKVHARITVFAPADEVLSRIHAAVGVVESIDESTCVLVTGADTLEMIAVYIGMLGLDFKVTEPPGLVEHLRVIGERYRKSILT